MLEPKDPTHCIHPIWFGPYEIDDAGNVTGTGKLILRDDYCGGIEAAQRVEVTGTADVGDGTELTVTLTFGAADISRADGSCNARKARRWVKDLRGSILSGESISIQAGFEESVTTNAAGRTWRFRTCPEYGPDGEDYQYPCTYIGQ